MKDIQERTNELENKLNMLEDLKFRELAKIQRTMLCCFTLILITMIVCFFVWINTSDEVSSVEMDNSDGINNYIGERGDIINGNYESNKN